LLRVFPVFVAAHYITIAVKQRKFRICQNTGYAKLCQARAEATHDHLSEAIAAAGNEPANQHRLARAPKKTGRNVRQIGKDIGGKVVHFHHTNTGTAVLACQDGGVIARLQGNENGGLA
jgi:hypothetical protein